MELVNVHHGTMASWQIIGMEDLVVAVVVDLGVAAFGEYGRHVAGHLGVHGGRPRQILAAAAVAGDLQKRGVDLAHGVFPYRVGADRKSVV